MALKTYVLLPHLHPTAPIFQHINKDQRVRLSTLPQWRPYLQLTFLDENEFTIDYEPGSPTYGQKIKNKWKGRNRTARLKMNSNTPWQDEQIEKEKIPANEKFTQTEYDAVKFIHNTLSTVNPAVQRFLEVLPNNKGFVGYCDSVKEPSYQVYDANVQVDSDYDEFKKRLAAANKIDSLDLKDAQDLLIRIFGTATEVPQILKAAKGALINFMDSSDDAVSEILKTDTNLDDEVLILIGRLVSEGKLSFDAVEGQVAKKKNNDWIPVKAIGSEHTPLERQRYFSEFLTSQGGRLLLDDLKNEVRKKEPVKEVFQDSEEGSNDWLNEGLDETKYSPKLAAELGVAKAEPVINNTVVDSKPNEVKQPAEKRTYTKKAKGKRGRKPGMKNKVKETAVLTE